MNTDENTNLLFIAITIISALLSGLLVAVLQYIITERNKKREARLHLIADLMAYRFVLSQEDYSAEDKSRFNAALNKIPIYFHHNRSLLDSYRDLSDGFSAQKFPKFIRLLLGEAGVKRNQIDDSIIEVPLVHRTRAMPGKTQKNQPLNVES